MKYWKQACAVSVIVVLAAIGGLYLVICQEEKGTDVNDKKAGWEIPQTYAAFPADIQNELYVRLHAFAQVLYQYDTAERKFYEGAEEYMTPEAYGEFCPADAPEENMPGAVCIRSTLMKANIYVFYVSETDAAVILESCFSLTQGKNGSMVQYLWLAVEKQDGQWMITECRVIDTLEE